MGSYDRRDGPVYTNVSADPASAANPFILAWWTSNHDDILARMIEELRWWWPWSVAARLTALTQPETIERWRDEDPRANIATWENVLMHFAIARADQLGLTTRKSERRKCPLCEQQFDEDSVPEPLVQRLGARQIDFCAPCLTPLIYRLRRYDLSAERILQWASQLTAVLNRPPTQFFGERKTDLVPLTTVQRLAVFKLLENAPSALCVEREFGSWRNVLVAAGIRQGTATPPTDVGNRRINPIEAPVKPTDTQLKAFLEAIDQPPSPWADEWFKEKTLDERPAREQDHPTDPDIDLGPLGAALIEALREAGEDPALLIRRSARPTSS